MSLAATIETATTQPHVRLTGSSPLLNEEQTELVDRVYNAIWREAMRGPLVGHNEGFMKVVAMRDLLNAGCSISEGGTAGDKLIRLEGTALHIERFRRPRVASRAGLNKLWASADLTIERPVRLVIELQARSAASTQDALFSANLYDDIERVRERRADAFVFVCDYALWLRLRGEKPAQGKRLRRSKFNEYFRAVLPDIWEDQAEASEVALQGQVRVQASRMRAPSGEDWVLMSLVHHGGPATSETAG